MPSGKAPPSRSRNRPLQSRPGTFDPAQHLHRFRAHPPAEQARGQRGREGVQFRGLGKLFAERGERSHRALGVGRGDLDTQLVGPRGMSAGGALRVRLRDPAHRFERRSGVPRGQRGAREPLVGRSRFGGVVGDFTQLCVGPERALVTPQVLGLAGEAVQEPPRLAVVEALERGLRKRGGVVVQVLPQREFRSGLQAGHGGGLCPQRGDDQRGGLAASLAQLLDAAEDRAASGPVTSQGTRPRGGGVLDAAGRHIQVPQLDEQLRQLAPRLKSRLQQLGPLSGTERRLDGLRAFEVRVGRRRIGLDPGVHGLFQCRTRPGLGQNADLQRPDPACRGLPLQECVEHRKQIGQTVPGAQNPFQPKDRRRRPGLEPQQLQKRSLGPFQLTSRLLPRCLPEHPVLEARVGPGLNGIQRRGGGKSDPQDDKRRHLKLPRPKPPRPRGPANQPNHRRAPPAGPTGPFGFSRLIRSK